MAPPVFAVGDLKAAGGIEFTAGKTGCAAKRAGISGRFETVNWKYLLFPSYRRRAEADMKEELESLAEIAGRRETGSLALAAENARVVWRWRWLDSVAADLRYALRTFAAKPAFAILAALSLALGIGANTAIYSFVEAIMIRNLPVRDPGRLALITWHARAFPGVAHSFSGNNYGSPETGMTSPNFPFPAFEELRNNQHSFSDIVAFEGAGRPTLQAGGIADLEGGLNVSGRFFSVLGVPPAAGRLIDDTDDKPGATPVVALGYEYAQRRFGEASRAVGQHVLVNNKPFTVIGVAAPGFFGVDPLYTVNAYFPLRADALGDAAPGRWTDANSYWVQMMGRLRDGVSLKQAESAISPVFQRFVAGTAANDKERQTLPRLRLTEGGSGIETGRARYAKPLYVLMALVGAILAIACANLASLLLARAAARRKEMAVRLSLGAGRWRVIRQLLTESVLLALLGGAAGLLIARWGIRLLSALVDIGLAGFTLRAGLNWNVLAATALLSMATGVIFGLAPALQATRVDLVSALKETRAGGQGAGRRRWRFGGGLRRLLIVSQVAITLLLLVAAGLFGRTLNKLNSIQLGFNREHLLLFNLNARQAGYKGDELARFYQALQTRVNAIPGVRSGTATNYALVSQSDSRTTIILDHAVPGPKAGSAYMRVGPDFLRTIEIPLVAGRDITARDLASNSMAAVVNQKFARKYFNGENPLGRHFGLGKTPDLEIVGVAADTRFNSLKQEIPEVCYIPYTVDAKWLYGLTFELRAAGDPMGLADAVRRAVREADPRIPIANMTTQSTVIDQTIGGERTFAMLSVGLAALAVLIACVGLYGTMSYTVARRSGEIGIRVALGAERGRLLWMVMGEAMALAVAGLAVGLPVALATSKLVKSLLFDMKPNDPAAMVGACVILLAVAAAASLAPAWRAARIDPWAALRNE